MVTRNDALDALMREYIDDEGARLLEQEALWHGRVPESTDRAARAALAAAGSGAALGRARPAHGLPSAVAAVRALAMAAAAAAVVSVGAYAVSPAVRSFVSGLFAGEALTDARAARAPGEYVIPPLGDEYTVVDEGVGERLAYRWFTGPEYEVLVEIAYRLPEDMDGAENVEFIAAGGLWGTYCEAEDTCLAILRDRDVFILVEFWGGDRQAVLDYAERLVEANR